MMQVWQCGKWWRWGCGIALLVLLVTLALVPGATPVSASTVTVRMIGGNAFSPASITIQPGTTVTWINKDPSEDHNVLEENGVFGGVTLSFNQTYSYIFPQDATGIYSYVCTFHNGMAGTVTIMTPTATATATNPPMPEPLRHVNAAPTVTLTSAPVLPTHVAAPTRPSANTPRAQPARH